MSMTRKNPLRVLGAGLAVGVMALSACAIDEEGSGGDASNQTLTVACSNQEDVCQAWAKAFEEESGIPTSYVRLSSGEAVARLESAKNSPEFDVWHGGPVDGYNVAAESGLIEQYESPNADMVADEFRDPDGYWTGIYVGVLGLCSNQSVLDNLGIEAPDSWEALLDPKLKGQIMMAHPATSGTAFTALWTQVVREGGEEQGLEWMKKLHANILQYTKSGSAPAQSAGRGEVAVGVVFSHDCVKYKEQGMSDLVTTIPSDGTGWEIGGVAIVANAKNKEAAQQYYDWTLTLDAQEIGPEHQSYQLLTNKDAKPDDRMVKIDEVNLVDYDFVEAANAKEALTARFDEEIAAAPKE